MANQTFFPLYLRVEGSKPKYIGGAEEDVSTSTYAFRMEDQVYQLYRVEKQLEGRASDEQRSWRMNLVTSYNFRDAILDKNGILCPRANTMVKFSVSGAGKIQAVEKGDSSSFEPIQ